MKIRILLFFKNSHIQQFPGSGTSGSAPKGPRAQKDGVEGEGRKEGNCDTTHRRKRSEIRSKGRVSLPNFRDLSSVRESERSGESERVQITRIDRRGRYGQEWKGEEGMGSTLALSQCSLNYELLHSDK